MSDGDTDPDDERGSAETDTAADAVASDANGETGNRGPPVGDDEADETAGEDEAHDTVGEGETHETTDESAYAVPTETESDAETAWRRELAEAGELTPEAVETLVRLHGNRGTRAVEAVSEGRIKRYRDFTVVVGHEDEYVVEDGGCTCKDSTYNLDPDDPHERCWHVLAVAIAERIGEIDHHEMWYSEVRDFL